MKICFDNNVDKDNERRDIFFGAIGKLKKFSNQPKVYQIHNNIV